MGESNKVALVERKQYPCDRQDRCAMVMCPADSLLRKISQWRRLWRTVGEMSEKRSDEPDIEKHRKAQEKRWRKRGAYDEAGQEERAKKLAAARAYLRRPLREFLEAVEINESDPEYEQFAAIWREFHES
jgi:hypothetical protein